MTKHEVADAPILLSSSTLFDAEQAITIQETTARNRKIENNCWQSFSSSFSKENSNG